MPVYTWVLGFMYLTSIPASKHLIHTAHLIIIGSRSAPLHSPLGLASCAAWLQFLQPGRREIWNVCVTSRAPGWLFVVNYSSRKNGLARRLHALQWAQMEILLILNEVPRPVCRANNTLW